MKTTFTAGQRLQINGEGDFFRLLLTTSPVNIDFYFQGREIAERLEVEAGFAEQFRTIKFDRVDIVSPLAQTVQFETALGSEIRYDRGAASITGTVALDGATLAALEQINARPETGLLNWNSSATMAANTPLTVFAPGANTNGAIIYMAQAGDRMAGNSVQVFIGKTSAPTTVTDGDIIAQTTPVAGGGDLIIGGNMAIPQHIAAGVGLYFISGLAGTAGFVRSCRYRLL